MKRELVLTVIVAASILIAGTVYVLLNDDDDSNESSEYIEFFFYDNHVNDDTSGVLSENKNIANGVWIKGYGSTKTECFEDACERYGTQAVLSEDGAIISWNGITDGNFHQMGWIYNGWSSTITLSSDETYSIRFMAIGHGLATTSGEPPAPWQGPDDIRWYYGESTSAGTGTAVHFYFYDNFENDQIIGTSSDITRFVADGYWVAGYGTTVADAFKNACSKLGKYAGYNDATGDLFRMDSINSDLHTLSWNGTAWVGCNMSLMSIEPGTFIAIGYGAASGVGEAPTPWETPEDIEWSL